jgi:hypothetical protein
MSEQWYVARGRQKFGPYSFAELKELARTGGVLPVEMVLKEGTTKWQPASAVEGLFWQSSGELIQGVLVAPPPASPAPSKNETVESAPSPMPPPQPSSTPAVQVKPENRVEAAVSPPPAATNSPLPPPALASQEVIEHRANPDTSSAPSATPSLPVAPLGVVPEMPHGRIQSPPLTKPPTPAGPQGEPTAEQRKDAPAEKKKRFGKWIATGVGVSALLGLIGDFLRPLAPFNLIAFVLTFGFVVALLVLRAKGRHLFGAWFAQVCTTSVTLAIGFGVWSGLALFTGSWEKGYLAKQIRIVDRVQSAMLTKDDAEGLIGEWRSLSSGDTGAELSVNGGSLRWVIPYPGDTSRVKIEANFAVTKVAVHGTTKEGILYGIITLIDPHSADGGQLPTKDETFSFRFSLVGSDLTVENLRGKGFEELKKKAEVPYKKK